MVPARRRWRFPPGGGKGSRLERAEVLVRGAESSRPEEAEVPARRWSKFSPVSGGGSRPEVVEVPAWRWRSPVGWRKPAPMVWFLLGSASGPRYTGKKKDISLLQLMHILVQNIAEEVIRSPDETDQIHRMLCIYSYSCILIFFVIYFFLRR